MRSRLRLLLSVSRVLKRSVLIPGFCTVARIERFILDNTLYQTQQCFAVVRRVTAAAKDIRSAKPLHGPQ